MAPPLPPPRPQRWKLGSATLADALAAGAGGAGFVRVDAVGSGWLYVRAEVHRDGALFTTEPVIGVGAWAGPWPVFGPVGSRPHHAAPRLPPMRLPGPRRRLLPPQLPGPLPPLHPPSGAGWEHPGYDGQESEGLCWTAKWLGYTCWLAPDAVVAHAH
jgi:hypothetical protein